MGHKVVCFDCKISFSQGTDFDDRKDTICPTCGKQMTFLPHRFRPPKKSDINKWETARYLVDNGFYYQHIYKVVDAKTKFNHRENFVQYPENLKDAKEFVEKYKSQSMNK